MLLLTLSFSKNVSPIVNYLVYSDDKFKQSYYKKNVFLDNSLCNDIDLTAISITNLFRLSLIQIDFTKDLDYRLYDKFIEHPLFVQLKDLCSKAKAANESLTTNGVCSYEVIGGLPLGELNNPDIEKGYIQLTPLGKSFTEICIS